MSADQAIPCGLILNELITNALKHGFADRSSGLVRVELRRTDSGQIVLAVADDGKGMPPGLRIETTSSLGMQLVATLTEQLDRVHQRRGHRACFREMSGRRLDGYQDQGRARWSGDGGILRRQFGVPMI